MSIREFMESLKKILDEQPELSDVPVFVALPAPGDYEWSEPGLEFQVVVPDGETDPVMGLTL